MTIGNINIHVVLSTEGSAYVALKHFEGVPGTVVSTISEPTDNAVEFVVNDGFAPVNASFFHIFREMNKPIRLVDVKFSPVLFQVRKRLTIDYLRVLACGDVEYRGVGIRHDGFLKRAFVFFWGASILAEIHEKKAHRAAPGSIKSIFGKCAGL